MALAKSRNLRGNDAIVPDSHGTESRQ